MWMIWEAHRQKRLLVLVTTSFLQRPGVSEGRGGRGGSLHNMQLPRAWAPAIDALLSDLYTDKELVGFIDTDSLLLPSARSRCYPTGRCTYLPTFSHFLIVNQTSLSPPPPLPVMAHGSRRQRWGKTALSLPVERRGSYVRMLQVTRAYTCERMHKGMHSHTCVHTHTYA